MKECRVCKETKDESEFPLTNATNRCYSCQRETYNAWIRKNPDKLHEYHQKHKESRNEYSRRYYQANKERLNAEAMERYYARKAEQAEAQQD